MLGFLPLVVNMQVQYGNPTAASTSSASRKVSEKDSPILSLMDTGIPLVLETCSAISVVLRTLTPNRPVHHAVQLKYPLDKRVCGAQTSNHGKGKRDSVQYQRLWYRTDYTSNTLFPHSQRLERAPYRSNTVSLPWHLHFEGITVPTVKVPLHIPPPPTPFCPAAQTPENDSNGQNVDRWSLTEEGVKNMFLSTEM